MMNLIKKLFCLHDWRLDLEIKELFIWRLYICKKCGKFHTWSELEERTKL